MKVTMIVSGFPTRENPQHGVFNYVTATRLSERHRVTVVHLRVWKPGRRIFYKRGDHGFGLVQLSMPFLPNVRNRVLFDSGVGLSKSVGRSLLKGLLESTDIIHAVSAWPAGLFASRWSEEFGTPLLVEAIGSDVNEVLPEIKDFRTVRNWERQVRLVACNSRALADAFSELYSLVPYVRTLYRGVDLERFSPDGELLGPQAVLSPVRFIYLGGFPGYRVGSHSDVKGGDILLSAWEASEQDLGTYGASLVIGGPGSRTSVIQRWHARLRKPRSVHIAGPIAPEQIPGYLRAADVVVIPSRSEGLPAVAIEAAACGCAILGSEVGGIPEVLGHASSIGELVAPEAVSSWAQALVRFASSPEAVRGMGLRARIHVTSHFDSSSYIPTLESYYALARPEA